jgi:pimeloyl-ACP methyl ester carboxylesterase
MTTLFYACMVLGIGIVYAIAAGAAAAHGVPLWLLVLGVPLAYVAMAAFLVLSWFAMSRFWADRGGDAVRFGHPPLVRMLVREIVTVVTSWPAIILHRLLVRNPAPGGAATVPLLLIHGVWNNDGVWVSFRRRLARLGIGPVYTINCGPPLADIERFAEQLDRRLERVCAASGAGRVVLIGHSMGGLIARAYLRRFGARRVALLVTIGTPHHGSMLATLAVGRCVEQMRPGNPWLVALNSAEPVANDPPIVSVWSVDDTMVAPQSNARLSGAGNVVLHGIAHNALLRDARSFHAVVAEIEGRGLAGAALARRGATSESPASTARRPSARA